MKYIDTCLLRHVDNTNGLPGDLLLTRDTDRFPENRFRTLAVRSDRNGIRPAEGGPSDVIPPVHLSTTFEWASTDEVTEHAYLRESNPTRILLYRE